MKKDDLIKKLELHFKAIENKNQQISQCIADLNILIGHKNECLYWINEFDTDKNLQKEEKKLNQINKTPITLEKFKEMTGAKDAYLLNTNN